jgi:mono/diheme cytochrome c family protein
MHAVGAGFALVLLCAAPAFAESGEIIFNENCVACHQVGATGVPGEYPRLAGRANVIAADPRGRDFLTHLVLTGMSGTITVDGRKILGIMPSFEELQDDELAAALNYVTGLQGRKGTPFTAIDIKTARSGAKRTPEQMAETRNNLAQAHIIP